jgi:hypothetical protein
MHQLEELDPRAVVPGHERQLHAHTHTHAKKQHR